MAPHSPVIALLSIKPIYANAILDGRKKVEFRKRPFKRPVSHVVIYATTPVQRVVGWFQTKHFEQMSPSSLWKRFASVGGISKEAFNLYYNGAESGVAIHVDKPRRLAHPVSIKRTKVAAAPQSYAYLSASVFGRLATHQNARPPKRLAVKKKKGKPVRK